MQYSAYTNVGRVRSQNQDCYLVQQLAQNAYLFTVCDGMGGASGGETASKAACEAFHSAIASSLFSYTEKDGILAALSAKVVRKLLIDGVEQANRTVYEIALEDPSLSGMGTTLVSALLINKNAYMINVGDSRAYYLIDDELTQITKDHSYVQYLVDTGKIQPEEAQSHPNKNIITRSVGTGPELIPDLFVLDIRTIDRLLLCSDGLTNMVSKNDMSAVLTDPEVDFSRKAERLAAIANIHGGLDNITAIVIDPRYN